MGNGRKEIIMMRVSTFQEAVRHVEDGERLAGPRCVCVTSGNPVVILYSVTIASAITQIRALAQMRKSYL